MKNVTLEDRFTEMSGEVLLSGMQAVTRLLINQSERDRRAGLKTGGFVSGYRGSPLGTLDSALARARKHLETRDIIVQPGVNEDLAATAVWGSQQTGLFAPSDFDGVFGLWYGKGPGVDRSVDAFKHANLAGTSRHGGVLVLAGDDHTNKSSTTPHQSELSLISAAIPVFHPSSLQDFLDFGIYAYALSRHAGIWASQKLLADLADSTQVADCDPARVQIELPEYAHPNQSLHISSPDLSVSEQGRLQEELLYSYRLPAAADFVRANPVDHVVAAPKKGRLGLVTSGRSYLDTLEALKLLDHTVESAARAGIGLLKIGLAWPLSRPAVEDFAALGFEQLLVIEEKRPVIEGQLREILYGRPSAPPIAGKRDGAGAVLLSELGELSPLKIAHAIATQLGDRDLVARVEDLQAKAAVQDDVPSIVSRPAYFCSGCPHNRSTVVPEGSTALGGVGCHVLALSMNRDNSGFTHMGAEGANWLGLAPFSKTKHVFQNMGDGTYFHSGYLAIRAAIASKQSITFKLLYNDAVAMTGGQTVDGDLSAFDMVRQMDAEGAARIAVVAAEPERWSGLTLPKDVTVSDRRDLLKVERELRDVEGTTILVYDQTCAAELRRRRKRGKIETPDVSVYINPLVCEGCGDCSKKSNCISVAPRDTAFGRKRQIDDGNCNKDLSCLDGFCPSFVTLEGAQPAKSAAIDNIAAIPPLPAENPSSAKTDFLVAGIGGTGVVTIGAILAMARHIEGRPCSVMDMTGMAQKGGAVLSHVRMPSEHDDAPTRLNDSMADVLLACDGIVGASEDALTRTLPGQTMAIMNQHEAVTGHFVLNPDLPNQAGTAEMRIEGHLSAPQTRKLEATRIAEVLAGAAVGANMVMLGYALQLGLVPVTLDAVRRAIELNGASVEMNLKALDLGRLAAHDAAQIEALLEDAEGAAEAFAPDEALSLDEVIRRRASFLTAYQNRAYAERFQSAIQTVRSAERSLFPDREDLSRAMTQALFRLMAIKDEYEVARLHRDPDVLAEIKAKYGPTAKPTYHFAPPLFSDKNDDGTPRKRAFRRGVPTVLSVLARLKPLRGTALDLFGQTAERKLERALRDRFLKLIEAGFDGLSQERYDRWLEFAEATLSIRGYGHVKEASIRAAQKDWQRLESELTPAALRSEISPLPIPDIPASASPQTPA